MDVTTEQIAIVAAALVGFMLLPNISDLASEAGQGFYVRLISVQFVDKLSFGEGTEPNGGGSGGPASYQAHYLLDYGGTLFLSSIERQGSNSGYIITLRIVNSGEERTDIIELRFKPQGFGVDPTEIYLPDGTDIKVSKT